jgi:prolipoprotein diacylglyceryltransferase
MQVGYALIMTAAIGTGFWMARRTQSGLQLNAMQRLTISLGAFIGAMLGAKLPFLFSDWQGFLSGAIWFSDGKTILTGLVGGYLGVEAAKWSIDVQTKTGDTFVLPVAIAIAIGRIGCFHVGCCYGKTTTMPWGVVFPMIDAQPRHPTQLYEVAFHLLAALGFYMLTRGGLFERQRIKLYIIAYAAYRFFTEWLRPEVDIYFGLTGYQIASLTIIILFAWLIHRDRAQSAERSNLGISS